MKFLFLILEYIGLIIIGYNNIEVAILLLLADMFTRRECRVHPSSSSGLAYLIVIILWGIALLPYSWQLTAIGITVLGLDLIFSNPPDKTYSETH